MLRKSFVRLNGDPTATLIIDVLPEERASDKELFTAAYSVRWALANEFYVIIAVVFQRFIPPAYAGSLLELARDSFISSFEGDLRTSELNDIDFSSFSLMFDEILRKAEQLSLNRARETRYKRASEHNLGRKEKSNMRQNENLRKLQPSKRLQALKTS